MSLMDDYLRLLRQARDRKLAELDEPIRTALIEDASTKELSEKRRALLDMPSKVTDGTRDELIKQWPADFPPLPLWFSDPAAASAADPPGPPCVVDCSGGTAGEVGPGLSREAVQSKGCRQGS